MPRRKFRKFRKRRMPLSRGQVKAVKSIIGKVDEQKYIRTTTTGDPSSGGGSIECLSLVAQGDDYFERIGKEIYLRSLEMRIEMRTTAAEEGDVLYRFIVVKARDTENALPSITEILQEDAIYSLRSVRFMDKFKVYYDKVIKVPKNDGADVSYGTIHKYIQLKKPVKASYSTAAGTIDACESNHFFLIMQTTATNIAYSEITGRCQMRFSEI